MSARRFHNECKFDNRRPLGSYVGLAPAPFQSGDMPCDRGMNKAGNARARVAAVQMAWMWLCYQPQSELARWYYSRIDQLGRRGRRIIIIALARMLVIALWQCPEQDKVPTAAIIAA